MITRGAVSGSTDMVLAVEADKLEKGLCMTKHGFSLLLIVVVVSAVVVFVLLVRLSRIRGRERERFRGS